MTNKEAITILSQCGWDGLPHGYTGGYREALDMAIEALINQQIKWGVKIEYDEGKIIAWGELQKP